MIRIADIKKNDIANGEGVCVSLWVQGCSHRCKGCHNPETWNPSGGIEMKVPIVIDEIVGAIDANGIMRNFSVLGGEPLDPQNVRGVKEIIQAVRYQYPDIKIFMWTGYVLENLTQDQLDAISNVDIFIDGRFEEDLKDLTLQLRGSSNQRILTREDIQNECKKRQGIKKESFRTISTIGIARIKK